MTTPEIPRDDGQDAAIRELAAQIAKMTKLGFDPMTIRKGIIAAVDDTAIPPTVSLNISGDTETLVTQVRSLNNYTPLVGQTVLVAKQGTEVFLIGSVASGGAVANLASTFTDDGWKQPTLAAGSGNGNSNGVIECRRVMDHGSWKMQWRGGWNVSGTTIISAGGLNADYRPSALRSLIAARNATGSNAVKVDFNTDGSVTIIGGTTAPSSVSDGDFSIGSHSHSHNDFYGASGEFNNGGTTGGAGGFSVGTHNHSVSVAAPTWVSLNGLEYFL